jgi:hypothetical protein
MEPAPIQILSRAAFDLMPLSAATGLSASEKRKPTTGAGGSILGFGSASDVDFTDTGATFE